MAVVHDTTVGAVASSVSSISVSVTVGNNPNRYMLIATTQSDLSPDGLSSINFNTTEVPTQLADVTSVSTDERSFLHELIAPSVTTANATATAPLSQNAMNIIATVFYGVDQAAPRGTVRTNSQGNIPDAWAVADGGQAGGMIYGYGMRSTTSSAVQSIAPVSGTPQFVVAGALSVAAAVTSRTPAAPAGRQRGDLELAHCSSENNATHSVSGSGWVKIGQTNSGASFTVSHYYRIFDGTNVDPAISWTGSNDASARRYLFRDNKFTGTPVAYHGTVGTGTTSPHTSTGANTTADDVLAVYIDICNANTGQTAETSWTERVDSGSATGPVRSYLADREFATSGSATGDISQSGGVAAWVQQQFELLRSSVADQTHRYEEESWDGDFVCTAVATEDVGTYNAMGWTPTGGTTAAVVGFGVAVHPAASRSLVFNPNPMQPFLAAA